MADVQEIEVILHADGSVDVQVHGARGAECLELTKKLEQYLGGQVVSREFTDGFTQSSSDGVDDADSERVALDGGDT